jgi:YhcH/YjgK/YiaL family protein
MIVAALTGQTAQTAAMQKAFAWLRANCADVGLPARTEIDGKAIYALLQEYETLPAAETLKCEAHRGYIDIQYIVSGEEMMGWAPLDALLNPTAYNPEKDVLFGEVPAAALTPVIVRAGHAAIFYPEDAHAPKLAVGTPCAVRKIVIKVQCA